jgi:myo-inositol-1(or 4)-monophosphatase
MGKPKYARYSQVAIKLAHRAGEMLRLAQNKRRTIDYKGAINLVTEMDRRSERLIGDGLKKAFPDHDFYAEENEQNINRGSEYRWIVDPLDGTTNYAHRLPIYSVSIALEHRGKVVVGIVYQPVLKELFVAELGNGATLNGHPIRVTTERRLERSLLVTGFPYDVQTSDADNLNHFRNFIKRVRAVRRLGSAALDLCYVACGRFDGFWEIKLSPWDLAAGALICSEAGGRVTDIDGRKFSIYAGRIATTNGKIHAEVLRVLRDGG